VAIKDGGQHDAESQGVHGSGLRPPVSGDGLHRYELSREIASEGAEDNAVNISKHTSV
jgi:hypothetical protein